MSMWLRRQNLRKKKNLKHRNLELGTWNLKLGTWNLKPLEP